MKKGIRILLYSLGGLVLLLLVAVLVLPVVFKPQILRFAKAQVGRQVNAEVDFSDVQISIWRGFPYLYVALEDVSVVNRAPFAGDTLAAFDLLAVRVNMGTLFDLSDVQVRSIDLVRPRLLAQRNALGQASWDLSVGDAHLHADTAIAGQPSDAAAEVAGDTATQALRVRLERLRVHDGTLAYRDDSTRMEARVEGLQFELEGDLGADRSALRLDLLLERTFFTQGGVTLAPGLRVGLAASLEADLAAKHYRLQHNRLSINEFTLWLDGDVSMPSDSVVLDVTFGTENADFKTLLSLVPAIYQKDFASLRVGGQVALQGAARGVLHGRELPSATLALQVREGMFHYPSLPKRAEDIHLDLHVAFDGKDQDATRVDLRALSLSVAGNPVRLGASLATPFSDPSLEAQVAGRVDLGSVGEVVPLEGRELSGLLEMDVALAARRSHVESKNYEACHVQGSVRLRDATVGGVLAVPARVEELDLSFSPQSVRVNALRARAGRTDVALQGGVQDFLPYLLADGTLQGQLDLQSDTVDLLELFPPSAAGSQAAASAEVPDPAPEPSIAEDPAPEAGAAVDLSPLRRIVFTFRSRVGHVRMRPVSLDAVVGNLTLAADRLSFAPVACRALGGEASLSGHFDYSRAEVRDVLLDADLRDIDMAACVGAFGLDKLLSTLQHARGRVGVRLGARLQLDTLLSPIMPSVQAEGVLSTSTLKLEGAPFFQRLGTLLGNEALKEPSLAASEVHFAVRDGRVEFRPFESQLAGMPTRIEGTAGLDQTVDFRFGMEVHRDKLGRLGSTVDQLASQLGMADALGGVLPIRVLVKGPASEPAITFDIDPSYKSRVADAAKQKAQEVLGQAKKRLQEEYDKLLRDAEAQGAKLVAEAERAAEQMRQEARKRSQQMVDEAKKKGIIAEMAAKKGAQAIVGEADRGADRLVSEARRQAEELLAKARAEGERLKAQ